MNSPTFDQLPQLVAELSEQLTRIEKKLSALQDNNRAQSLLTSEAVCEKYNISQRTLQNYRNKRMVPFSQIGQKIWYCQADLDQFFSNHKIK